jgi:transposase
MTVTKTPEVEVFEQPRPGRKRRYTTSQKQAILDEAALPGNSISSVARKYGISPSLVFRWNEDAGRRCRRRPRRR